MFVDLPDAVLNSHLLPHLKLNDVLRMRRVCKSAKVIADTHLGGVNGVPLFGHHIEINVYEDDYKSFNAFMKLGFSVSRIFLNNGNMEHEFFECERKAQAKFLRKYGERITHLKIDEFPLIIPPHTMKFLESLPNLTHLELGTIVAHEQRKCACVKGAKKYGKVKGSPEDPRCKHFPETFRSLKSLKIGSMLVDFGNWTIVDDVEKFVRFCGDHLEYFGFPEMEPVTEPIRNNNILMLEVVYEIVDKRRKESPGQPNLKYLDLEKFAIQYVDPEEQDDEWTLAKRDSQYLIGLQNTYVYKHGLDLKLLNVNASLFEFANDARNTEHVQLVLENAIVSFTNFQPTNFYLFYKHLEKIVIDQTSECYLYEANLDLNLDSRLPWATLKTLEICVDSMELPIWNRSGSPGDKTENLLKYFFVDIQRPALTELKLVYDLPLKGKKEKIPWPAAEDLIASCPNLKKLSLSSWPGTNKALSQLWSGLPHLEEVTLSDCEKLGNVAFVGEDVNNPTFLMLKNIKKLSLNGLDKMPKVTDTAFKLVFRHLKLSHFKLSSENAMKNVTLEGIKGLLTGEFGKSIERFPFKGWSLEGVSHRDFEKLAKEFRSSYMI